MAKNGKNCEGYSDSTAFLAMNNIKRKAKDEEDYKRFHALLSAIFNICDLAGFEIQGRLTVLDKRSGRIWK